MKYNKLRAGLNVALTIFVVAFLVTNAAGAPREKILYNFGPSKHVGVFPMAGLIFDSSGNLYGTTSGGTHHRNCGFDGCGTVFKLSPKANAEWNETQLWSFDVSDGFNPTAALIFDGDGNLYSTTQEGGGAEVQNLAHSNGDAAGNVFELSPRQGGGWRETVLHTFSSSRRGGSLPASSLIFDGSGNLYGTTSSSGVGWGVAFELSPKSRGGWKETVLHVFKFNGKDGNDPQGNLILDASGNLYGTTAGGGDCNQQYGCGTVFELSPKSGGGWKETLLHNFNGNDGEIPYAGLIFDAVGTLYGTTFAGGTGTCSDGSGFSGCGTVFELTPKTGGGWTETVLYSFKGKDGDGSYPTAGVVIDAAGNLYGTTEYGGGVSNTYCVNGCGSVFKLTPKSDGSWTETVLHSFSNNGEDGTFPLGGVILDSAGNLYGTTYLGGNGGCGPRNSRPGCGIVFEIIP